ncbi:MAG: SbcC/MukB-like Walker B domain-containing protein, partial [Chloroflexi bacterium]|nr:SbcC/MukB-like Walker B domain-containing protein [Chloroflexota bacterium]
AATLAAAAAATAAGAARKAEQALEAVTAKTGTRDALAEAQSALDALAQAHAAAEREQRAVKDAEAALTRAQADAKAAGKQHASAVTAETKARKAAESAEAASLEARAALDAAQHRDMALAVRSGVATGDACPVCGQHVATLPPAEAAPDLDAARKAEQAARAAATRGQAALQQASSAAGAGASAVTAAERAAKAATEALTKAQQETATATARVTDATSLVSERLGPPDKASAVLAARRTRLAEAEQAAQQAARTEQTARTEAESVAKSSLQARQAFTALRLALANAAGALGIPAEDVDGAPAVRALLESLRAGYASTREATQERRKAADAAMQAAEARLRDVLTRAGIDPSSGFEEAVTAVRERIARIDGALEADRRAVEGLDALEQAASVASERLARYGTLKDDLTPSQFLGYLLAEERATLANIGSERFEQLSGGRYRFKDQNFAIVDLAAAEAERNADTLSGGETFLASLALALALAEMVAREGGRLDAFFLDEGFGSLDEEHLDLAMEGIERLVGESADRLVVIVSHVPALRERIEDLIVLDREPATGHTLVRRGAGPRE